MAVWANLFLLVHIVAAIAIVVLVLLQHGKGADMGAAFGSGSAGSLFGSSGASNFLSKATAGFAALFFATSLALTYYHAPKSGTGVMGGAAKDAVKTEPAKEGSAAAIPVPSAPSTPAAPAVPDATKVVPKSEPASLPK